LEDIKLPSTTVLTSIGILIVSFLIGFLFFYVTTDKPKDVKKKLLENVLSLLINFVIFIWVGKILVNSKIFFQDPLAILAYPSNTVAFYVATAFIAINVTYHLVRNKLNGMDVFNTFVPVLLSASFIFNFAQLVIIGYQKAWIYVVFLAILLVFYLFIKEKATSHLANLTIFVVWLIGQFILSVTSSFPSLFGYNVHALFFISLLILVLIYIVYSNKRKV